MNQAKPMSHNAPRGHRLAHRRARQWNFLPDTQTRQPKASECPGYVPRIGRQHRSRFKSYPPHGRHSYNPAHHPPADHRPSTLSPPRFGMTAADTKTTKSTSRFRLADPPEREPDDMTRFHRLAQNGNA